MPTLEALDALKKNINELGDEPRILAERGEKPSDIRPPEISSDPELERMLDEEISTGDGVDEMEALLGAYSEDLEGLETPESFDSAADSGGPEEDIDDFSIDDFEPLNAESFDDLLGDSPAEDLAEIDDLLDNSSADDAADADNSFRGSSAEEIEDIEDLFGDIDIDEAMEDFPGDDSGVESDEKEEIGTDDSGPADFGGPEEDTGDFSIDDFEPLNAESFDDLLGDSSAEDAAEIDDLLDDSSAGNAAEGDNSFGGSPADEVENIDDLLDDLDFGDVGAAGGEETEPLSSSEPNEEPDGAEDTEDDFSLEDLNFDEMADEGFPEEESPGIDELGDEEPGNNAPEDEAPPDDFSFDDLDFGEAETAFEDSSMESLELPEDDEGLGDLGTGDLDDFSLDDLDFGESDEDSETESFESGEDESEEAFEIEELEESGELEVPDEIGDDDFETPENLDENGLSPDEDSFDSEELGELDDLEDAEEIPEEIPDVESALDDLGDLDSLDEGSQDELSFDDELNFDEELGADALADITDIDDDNQQFSMEDFGEQYNFKEGEDGYADNLGVDLEKLEQSLDEAAEDEAKPFSISEEDFEEMLETLASLPRNLQMALEELLADERRNPQDLQPLIDALIDGDSPKALADQFKSITKRSIKLPRSYQKRSGRALEERRAALVYQLVKEGWPVVRTILAIIAAAWGVTAALFMWVYRPLKAESLYEKGLEAVSVDNVDSAVSLFHDAWDGWPLFAAADEEGDRIADAPVVVKGWKNDGRWLDYARAFRRRKHWNSACDFYDGYLAVRPGEKDARLEYAEFLSGILGRYPDALDVLEGAPRTGGRNPDRDYTLAAGDVYLDWAEDDPSKYEEARFRYAKVLETSRNDERAILSMMRYNLRLNNEEEIETLLPIFKSEVPGQTDEPELAAEVFADLGDYHLLRGEYRRIKAIYQLGSRGESAVARASLHRCPVLESSRG